MDDGGFYISLGVMIVYNVYTASVLETKLFNSALRDTFGTYL